jgi:uncharacterized protein VirK/YbjX
VGHRPTTALLERQARLGPVQCLNLALFIHTQYESLLGRIQLQSDDVGHLLEELRVTRQLEGLHPMRLQVMGLPYGPARCC